MTYFPQIFSDTTTSVTLYVNPPHTSIYSSHVRQIVEHCVESTYKVAHGELCAPGRSTARISLVRQIAMYLAHVVCGLSLTEAGKIFGRDRTTVAHGCKIIEDLRDDPIMDRALSILENALISLLRINCKESA